MRITKIDIPEATQKGDGLEHIKMDKLGQIVLIAGKNGSGKTRILGKIFHTLTLKPTKADIESAKMRILAAQKNIADTEVAIENHKKVIAQNMNKDINITYKNNIVLSQKSIDSFNSEIKRYENSLKWKLIETSEEILDKSNLSTPYVPKKLDLLDSNDFQKNQLKESANNINSVGVSHLKDGTLAKIQVIQDRWFNTSHHISKANSKEKKEAEEDYTRLNSLIQIFINTELGRTNEGETTLFGFPMGKANLSDGQKILLQYCLAIYSQGTALKDLILILDEPENHLHPSVIIETIERIKECVPNGQIWIATHSVPLLAHFDPSLIWYVENNRISHAGKTPEKVLESLLGNEERITKLHDFIGLPAQYAINRHAFECLFESHAVDTKAKDPQSIQIKASLQKLLGKDSIKVLDYGAGKGRLISNIYDLDEMDKTNLIKKMDYVAFDKYDGFKEDCQNAIVRVYGDSKNRYFNDLEDLFSKHDKGTYDVVIMCNVLHEIDPLEWLKLFGIGGEITSTLSGKGILLLVEDYQMPTGEKAYQKGFLVLDTLQLKELFKISAKDEGFSSEDMKGNGRIKAHFIPKTYLERIDATSRLETIKSISKKAKVKIREIRDNKETNYQNGKLHGFWTQQLANAELGIEELATQNS
jgi:predicted ATPase